ncbi:MAG: rRNA maturation RNase YbeY [Candidatus Pacebacteria bacterium]|nr:rRNA maturation RNase YbeY [Candidatus Paceibacterota bacterium]
MEDQNLSITTTLKGKTPRLPFVRMKEEVLGKRYSLSLVFIGDQRARTLNKRFRNKDYVPDVLSFPLEKTVGEIFINPYQARRRARDFDMNTDQFIALLFIHGMLHLKGLRHGSTMERKERAYLDRLYS